MQALHFACLSTYYLPSIIWSLPLYSRSSKFSSSWRFPVYNLFWNPSFRHSLHVSIPYELSVLYFIDYCMRSLHNFPHSLICYLSRLDLPTALHQKSISVLSNIRFVVSLIDRISHSHLYVITLLIMVSYISLVLLLFMFLSQSIPFGTVMAFLSSRFRSLITMSNIPSFVFFTPKY